jgi:hypothetical protein
VRLATLLLAAQAMHVALAQQVPAVPNFAAPGDPPVAQGRPALAQFDRPALLAETNPDFLPKPEDEIMRLNKHRYQAALQELFDRWSVMHDRANELDWDATVMYLVAQRVMEAELALSESAEGRIAVGMRYVDFTQVLARRVRQAYEAKQATAREYALARWYVWDALLKAIDVHQFAERAPGDTTTDLAAIVAEWLPTDTDAAVEEARKQLPQDDGGAPKPKILEVRPVAIAATDKVPRKAAKARVNAAIQEMQWRFAIDQGRDWGKLAGTLDVGPRLLQGAMSLDLSAKGRVDLHERYWELAKRHEQDVVQEVRDGLATPVQLASVRYLRLDAELDVLYARQDANLPTDDLGAPVPPSDLPKSRLLDSVLGELITERPMTIQPNDDAKRRLLKLRHRAALEELLWRYADPNGSAPVTLEHISRLLESELPLRASPGERVRIRRKIFETAKICERYAKAGIIEKRATIREFARAQYDRFDAELQLFLARREAAESRSPAPQARPFPTP